MNKENAELWIKFENHLLNEGISKNRISKLRMLYHLLQRAFNNRNLLSLERPDIENFIVGLNKNTFKREDGGDYSGNSKSDIKKFIKQFWKVIKGNNESYPLEVSWIKTKISKDEKRTPEDVLSYQDVIRLAHNISKVEYRAMVLILFDSGFRISELLSVKKRDLTFEEYAGTKKCFWIKCNESKTFVRKIPIPLFTEDIQNFVNSTYYRSLDDNNLIWDKSNSYYYQQFKIHGLAALKRADLHAHLFRHSSATYWAKELEGNTIALAQRYGWTLSAEELKIYVRMSGAFEKASVKKVYENETLKLKERFDDMDAENKELKAELDKLKKVVMQLLHNSPEVKDIKLKAKASQK